MVKSIDFNPFDFNNVGMIKVFRCMVVDHILDKKDNKRINYYRLKYLPYMDTDGNISDVSGRVIEIINSCGVVNTDKKINIENNKYLHISSPTMIPIGTEVFVNITQLDAVGEFLFNIIWLSRYTKENMPTVNKAFAVRNKLKTFIGSNRALKDVHSNRPIIVLPGMLAVNNIVFENKCYDNIKPTKLRATKEMLQSLINKTSHMVYRHFVSKANTYNLFTRGIIDRRVLSRVLVGNPVIPKSAENIEINGKYVNVTLKELVNIKGIRKYVDTVKKYEISNALDNRDGPYHIYLSYIFSRKYGEDWLNTTDDTFDGD